MTAVAWSSADVVLAGQLVSAAALAVHLLILRPRAARRDLLLDARIVQDELDLAERLGQVCAASPETLALQQLLRRVRQNPRSAALVLDRIPALARATQRGSVQTHVEYVGGALDRLGDAGQRYLRGAWPRAGALSAGPPVTPVEIDLTESGLNARPEIGFPTADDEDEWDDEPDTGLDDEDEPDSDLDVDEPPWTTAEESFRPLSPRTPAGGPDEVDLTDDDPDWSPAWVDLVRTESSPRIPVQVDRHDRHSRPFRPARSSTHANNRPVEPVDRTSVLPR